jgi:catechol 2,3-dioxygenase
MIDPAISVGAVHLTIADLERSIAFYESRIGVRVQERTHDTARLGVEGRPLVTLHASPTARRAHGATGLYHFAILVPSRLDLARSLRHFIETSTAMQGFADHGVSEALYLADPDGNGIEVYRDRPRDEWVFVGGALQMGVDPLDAGSVLAELERAGDSGTWTGLAAGTVMGHMHLQVSLLDAAERFYADVLDFDVMARYTRSAVFLSGGGYHHHLGLNTWAGVGAPPPPAGAIGLRHFDLLFSSASTRDSTLERVRASGLPVDIQDGDPLLRDPSGNAIALLVGQREKESDAWPH